MSEGGTRPVRVRFAPSPTGRLHIGGARTAIYNWAFAKANGGTFVLRIEDTDAKRSSQEDTEVIQRALAWLGLDWDEGPGAGGQAGPYFQSQRGATYVEALEALKAKGAVYPCFCSVAELEARRAAAEAETGGWGGYDRACRDIPADVAAARIAAGEPHVWRLKVPAGHGPIAFTDAVMGPVSFPAEVMDDMVLVRGDGSPTYNFAVVCDDTNMGITHVIRGDDHLSNTPRQILVYEALGTQPPVFAHLSMILGPDGKKLSKRHGAASVEEYRDEGYLPDALVNYLALLGWSMDGTTTIIDRPTLASAFTLGRVTKKDAVFDAAKLDWMNGVYIREMGAQAWADLAAPWLYAAGATPNETQADLAFFAQLYPLVAQRLVRLDEIPGKLAYMFWGPKTFLDAASMEKTFAKDPARAQEALQACRGVLADAGLPWECEPLQLACRQRGEGLGFKARDLFAPLRVAVCGNMVSPPLFESIELLAREDVLARIDQTLDEAGHAS